MRTYALPAGCVVAPTCPSSLHAELVLMLTRITQLRALSLTPATNFFVAPACSSSLQTELVLMLTRPAEARTILRIGRSWKHHEKQTRRRNGNNRPIITHVTYLLFPHRDNNRKAGPKHLSICLPRFSFWRVGAYQGSAFRSQVRYLSTNYESEADSAAGSFCGGRRNRDRDAKSRSASVSLRNWSHSAGFVATLSSPKPTIGDIVNCTQRAGPAPGRAAESHWRPGCQASTLH